MTVTGGAPASTLSCTGARHETTTGNLDLHARRYNTATGRFNSTDPVTQRNPGRRTAGVPRCGGLGRQVEPAPP
ncbi:hypothetical protein OG596_07340 [Streptomyces sp. NBC_01102]|uniref:hypothetical protein n=1 Tax=unclassified Streptomyces TaxID=2593676 RepID=UPI00386B4B17|nr:hypothetical protein OG596_07340 [Streptomyces sp. NBC_01102]